MNNEQFLNSVKRTTSKEFYPERIRLDFFQSMAVAFICDSEDIDTIKKDLFYGIGNLGKQTKKNPVELTSPLTTDILHASLGFATEAGELLEAVKDSLNGNKFDLVNADEEVGDILWYVGLYCNARGISIESLMDQNTAKLKTRYPEKFTPEKANNRDLEAERAVLEGKSAE